MALPTLIDHFTSLRVRPAAVYSYQLIKLELLTPSIRQQKLPPRHAVFGIRPGCPCGLGSLSRAVASCFGRLQSKTERYFPIEMLYFSKVRQRCQSVILNKIKVSRRRNTVCFSELALARHAHPVYNNLNHYGFAERSGTAWTKPLKS